MPRGKFIDLSGKRFERLLVISLDKYERTLHGTNRAIWKCQCDCGNIVYRATSELNRGNSKSCGCLAKELLKSIRTKPYKNVLENDLYTSYRLGAKRRDYKFNLTKDQFVNLIYGNCHYCGINPNRVYSKNRHGVNEFILVNGIDRKDNNIGYTTENCVSCCWECNKLKLSLDYDEFLNKILFIYRYRIENNGVIEDYNR